MQRLLIAALTMLVFGTGYAVRAWTERDRAVLPPPVALGAEFSHNPGGAKGADGPRDAPRQNWDQPIDRAKLITEIEEIRPKVEAYRARLDAIDSEFSRDFLALLTPAQKGHYLETQKDFAERRAKNAARDAADAVPLSDEQIYRLQYQRPLYSVLGALAITPRLEGLTRDLKLDEAQQNRARELLQVRREKFIDIVDASPPPTITLSRLLPVVRKLAGAPEKK